MIIAKGLWGKWHLDDSIFLFTLWGILKFFDDRDREIPIL